MMKIFSIAISAALLAGLVFLGGQAAEAAIALNSSTSAHVTPAASSCTISSFSAAADSLLLVQVAVENSTAATVQGVTFNSADLTQIRQDTDAGGAGHGNKCVLATYYSTVNSDTSADIVVTLNASATFSVGVLDYTGISMTDPVGADEYNVYTAKTTTPSISLSTEKDDSWILAMCLYGQKQGDITATAPASQRWRQNAQAVNYCEIGADESTTALGSYAVDFYCVSNKKADLQAVEIKAADPPMETPTPTGTPGGPTATPTHTPEGPVPTATNTPGVPTATPVAPTPTPPIDLTPDQTVFSTTDTIAVTADIWPLTTPCYPFIRIQMADGSTLYYQLGVGFSASPVPYLGFEAGTTTTTEPIMGYPALVANFSGIATGTYYLEGGAVDATQTTSAADLVYWGTVDREALTVQ